MSQMKWRWLALAVTCYWSALPTGDVDTAALKELKRERNVCVLRAICHCASMRVSVWSDCCVYLCLRQQSVLCVLVHFVFGLLHNNDCGNVRNVSEFISGEIWFLHHKKSLISHPHPYPHRSTQPKCFPHPSSSVMHSPIFTFLLILP